MTRNVNILSSLIIVTIMSILIIKPNLTIIHKFRGKLENIERSKDKITLLNFEDPSNLTKKDPNLHKNLNELKHIPPLITILAWTKLYAYFGIKLDLPNPECQYSNCIITQDKGKLSEAHMIFFHLIHLRWKEIPKTRRDDQIFILYDNETPDTERKINLENRLHEDYFNWTMGYRRDADIARLHLKFLQRSPPLNEKEFKVFLQNRTFFAKNKTKLASQFVSHCGTAGKREKYVKELQKYIPVDVYGKCGSLKCGRNGYMNHPQCESLITTDYKFYLSFENSMCRYYITEKFIRPLKYYAVPIVIRAIDYEGFAPAHSYIAADKFASVEALAKYMQYLDSNLTAYMEYFHWHKDYVIQTIPNILCSICEKYNKWVEEGSERKSYGDMKKWMVDEAGCAKGYAQSLI